MDSHVLVFGRLTFPKGGLTRWRKTPVQADAFDDWKGELGGGLPDAGTLVRKMLQRFRSYAKLTGGLGQVDVEAKGKHAQFVGFLMEDAFRSLATEVAATFRTAGAAGGEGALNLLFVDGEEAYRVTVERDASSCSRVRSKKKLQALWDAPLCELASQRYERAVAPAVEKAEGLAPGPRADPTALDADPWPRLVSALESHGPATLHEALLARGGWFSASLTKVEPVERAFANGKALFSSIQAGEPEAIKPLAFELLTKLDPGAARSMAMSLLTADAPDDLLAAAAGCLREAGDQEATVALARALAHPPLDQPTVFRSMLAASLASAPDAAVAAAVAVLDTLANRPDAAHAQMAILELALRRNQPILRQTAGALLDGPEPRLRELAASALLGEGSDEALELLLPHVDQAGALGRSAIRALFRLDPKAAHDRIAPYLEGPAADVVRRQLLGHLSDAVATSRKAPELREPRFVDLALETLDEPGAVTFLGYTKDPRVPRALSALLPKRFEEVCEALKRVGDPSALPALRAAQPQAPNPHCKKLVARVIKQLEKKAGAAAPV